MSSSTGKMFVLRSGDGVEFEVEEAVLRRVFAEHREGNDMIITPNLTGETLSKVIEYCKKHAGAGDRSIDDEIKAWDADFVKVDDSTLYDLLIAANWLGIKELRDLTHQAIIDMIDTKPPDQFRALFKVQQNCLRNFFMNGQGQRFEFF